MPWHSIVRPCKVCTAGPTERKLVEDRMTVQHGFIVPLIVVLAFDDNPVDR